MIMQKRRRSLFFYISLPMIILLVVTAMLTALFSILTLRTLIYQAHYHRLETTGQVLAASVLDSQRSITALAPDLCARLSENATVRVTFIGTDGLVFADSREDPEEMENHGQRSEIRRALYGEPAFSLRRSPTLSVPMLYYALPLFDEAGTGEPIAVLRISTAAANIQTVISSAAVSIGIATFLLLAATVLTALIISRRISRPLSIIAERAARYAEFDFSSGMRSDGPAEIVRTADALQRMARALTGRIDEVTEQKQELEAILTGMSEGVIVLDRDLVITEINPAAVSLFAVSDQRIIGKSLIQVVRNTELDGFTQKALRNTVPLHFSLLLPTDQNPRHLQINAAVIEGSTRRLIMVITDITGLKHLERIRKEFVANVSHELKTPITSIKGFVETLLDGAVESREDALRFLNIIRKQTARLSDIIDDLLTLSRLDQQDEENEIRFERTILAEVVESAVAMSRTPASEKGTSITVECDGRIEVAGNQRLLEQAILNLVDNAVKYSPPGSSILVRAEEDSAGGPRLLVEDNGPGIPASDRDRIFERFYRVEKGRSRDTGGTGLGLAIVKHIMLVHGGAVSLESPSSGGARFVLEFPGVWPAKGDINHV